MKIYKLLKKEIKMSLNFLMVLLSVGTLLSLFSMFNTNTGGFVTNLVIIWSSIGLAAMTIIPHNTISIEEKDNSYKMIKCLPVNNFHVFFSKYLCVLIVMVWLYLLPVVLFLAIASLFKKIGFNPGKKIKNLSV